METYEQMAASVLQAYQGKLPIPRFSRRYEGFDLAAAYKVQKFYVELRLRDDEIGGFKAGLTSEEIQKKFGFEQPVSGILFTSGRLEGSPIVDGSQFGHMLVEQEFGFEIGERIVEFLPDIQALRAKVRSLRPMMELGDAGYGAEPTTTPILDLVAANCGSSHYIVGRPQSPTEINLDRLQLFCQRDEQELSSWRSAQDEAYHWNNALWLSNSITGSGRTIEPGHILITGGLGEYFRGTAGKYYANFDALGAISFEIR